MNQIKGRKLLVVILAKLLCTSVWFAGNSVFSLIAAELHLAENQLSVLLLAVQAGFVIGTLVYAFTGLVDRFSAVQVFFISALLAAVANVIPLYHLSWFSVLSSRLVCGFFLAGIYPVGIKILADGSKEALGSKVSWLVAALVLGSAFPFFIQVSGTISSISLVLKMSSLAAVIGGLLMVIGVSGQSTRLQVLNFRINGIKETWELPQFKAAAKGYFGHMWELYAFWGVLPLVIKYVLPGFSMPLLMVAVFLAGIGGCLTMAYLSKTFTYWCLARFCLISSGLCCLISPVVFLYGSSPVIIVFWFVWGFFVIADSPMFSALVAENAIPQYKGAAITLVNGTGFLITIFSLGLTKLCLTWIPVQYVFLILLPGAIYGVVYMQNTIKQLH